MNPCGTFESSYQEDIAIVRTRAQWFLLIALLVFLFTIPLFMGNYGLSVLNWMGIVLICALGVNIVTGYCGQISIGQAAFMAVGAYTSAILCSRFGVPFLAALPCAGLASALMGILFGLPSLRVKGFYLAIATLAAQFLIIYVIMRLEPWTGGGSGMMSPRAEIGGFIFNTEAKLFYLIMGIAVIMVFFAKNLTRTKVGRAFIAIRDNDLAAEIMGINLLRYKLLAFALSAFYAGIAGSLWAHWSVGLHPDQFSLMDAIWYLAIIIVGGMGSVTGVIFGTVFMQLLRQGVNMVSPVLAGLIPAVGGTMWAALTQMVFGLVIIIFLIYEPRGLYHRWEIIKTSYRLWPFTY